ncbi:MAG: peptidase [Cyanobacteria bacterium P01_H01_bin.15]
MITAGTVVAQSSDIYNPSALTPNQKITEKLTDKDIPTGQGGFARDYRVRLEAEDQVAIDVFSEEFDAMVILIAEDGSTVAENDDGPDGSTNSLLFARITETSDYIIRVRSFGETGSGHFTLKLTRLRSVPSN